MTRFAAKALLPILCLVAFSLYTDTAHAARAYVPVDQLGRGSSLPTLTKHPARNTRSTRAPLQTLTYVSPSGELRLFGTIEFRRPLESLPGWLDVLKRNEASPIFIAGKYFNKKSSWDSLKAELSGLSQMEQLRKVNTFWNTWPYREDMANWGKADYWAIPAQFIAKSGDCEDYAIAKYFTLKALGFDPQKMRLVVLKDTVRNLAHAVLAVFMDNDAYILDNLSNVVLSHRRLANYLPQYSVNEYGRWSHIRGKN